MVKNGKSILFWKDTWLFDSPLCVSYPDLFKLCEQPDILVSSVMNDINHISFLRWLPPDLELEWNHIVQEMLKIQTNSMDDVAVWKLEKNGRFSVKSAYNALSRAEEGNNFRYIWKGKIPAKIKIFLWLIANEAILTKDNMLKRQWRGILGAIFAANLKQGITYSLLVQLLK